MEVYEFNKDLTKRYAEIKNIFDNFTANKHDQIAASQIHSVWVNYAEITIEPAGWTALWRVSRFICKELKLKYPSIIYGMVQTVYYKELKCVFKIVAVEDDEIHLPELHEVPLDELYPTVMQENSDVKTSTTASSIDQLRFFYNHLWMPWDSENDDDINWIEKNLQLRWDFYYDIKMRRVERYLANHINNLLLEARNIQKRREYLELDLSDSEDGEDGNSIDATALINLRLRMNTIKNEIEMLQNPKMRAAYKEINFNQSNLSKQSSTTYLVLQEGNLFDKINYLEFASKIVENTKDIFTCGTLQEVLNKSDYSDTIYIPTGDHKISFRESLNSRGMIMALIGENLDNNGNAIISAANDERVLLSFDGDFTLENVTLDCRNVRTGILIHNGCIVLKNCKLFDDGKSAVKQGIVAIGRASVKLINCNISNFVTGISLKPEAKVLLMDNTIITNCDVGIELQDDCTLGLFDSKIMNSKSRGVYYETTCIDVLSKKKQIFDNFGDINLESITVNQNFTFDNNKYGNIVVCNKRMSEMYMSSFIGNDIVADVIGNDMVADVIGNDIVADDDAVMNSGVPHDDDAVMSNGVLHDDDEMGESSVILINDSFTDN